MGARKLPYPIYAPIQIEGTSNQTLPSLPSLDGWTGATPTDEIDVVFRLSLRQFVQIASMIDIGRDLGYPNESEDLWAMWAGRIISLGICESVEDCVDNSEGVREALDRWFESSTGVQTRIEAITNNYYQTLQPTPSQIACDDELFGGILALVEYIHQRNVDFFEEIEVASNILELASRLVSTVPIIGVITTQLTVSAIEGALENIAENYLAQWTVDSAFDIACEIYCLVDCGGLSLDTAVQYFEQRVGNQFTFSIAGLLELLESVATGDYTNVIDFIAWASYFQLQFVRLASGDIVSWLAFDTALPRQYGRAIQLGYLNPTQAWTLCDDCPPSPGDVVFDYDFTASDGGWVPSGTLATYSTGNGWRRGASGSDRGWIYIRQPSVVETIQAGSYKVTLWFDNPQASVSRGFNGRQVSDGALDRLTDWGALVQGENVKTFSIAQAFERFEVRLQTSTWASGATVTRIRLEFA